MKLAASLLVFSLMIFTAPAQADTPATTKLDPRDPNALRCKRLDITGSLVRKVRVCHTNAEWTSIAAQQERDADNLVTRSRAGMDCRTDGSC